MRIETRSAVFERKSNEIVYMFHREDWPEPDTLQTAKENVDALTKLIDGKNRGFIVYFSNSWIPKEILEYYRDAKPGQVATAFVVNSFATKVVANLFLKLASGKDREPTKVFSTESDAEAWVDAIMGQYV